MSRQRLEMLRLARADHVEVSRESQEGARASFCCGEAYSDRMLAQTGRWDGSSQVIACVRDQAMVTKVRRIQEGMREGSWWWARACPNDGSGPSTRRFWPLSSGLL